MICKTCNKEMVLITIVTKKTEKTEKIEKIEIYQCQNNDCYDIGETKEKIVMLLVNLNKKKK